VSTLRRVGKRIVNPALAKVDLALVRRSTLDPPPPPGVEVDLRWKLDYVPQQYVLTIRELEGCLSETLLPPLPEDDRRTALLAELYGTTISEAFFLLSYLRGVLELEGDVAEFGVAHGATSALIANEILHTGKTLWLFDSFAGLPAPTEEDVLIDDWLNLGSMEAYEGTIAYDAGHVRARLDRLGFPPERTRIVPGDIEETVEHAREARFAFAYVDFDFYRPIRTVLELMRDRLVPGGALVVDDYGHFSAGVQQAVDEFVAANPRFSLILPPKWAREFAILTLEA
jgi:hypothetical protein